MKMFADWSDLRAKDGHTPLQHGDRVTIAGHYRRRTFWEWITGKPKELQEFVIFGDVSSQIGSGA